jgi:hypothetical protein
MRERATVLLCTAALLPAALSAQSPSRPNFTGTWVMDVAKSGASTFTPTASTYTIVHVGDTLVIDRATTSTNGDQVKAHMRYVVDGGTWKNMLPLVGQSLEASSVLRWAGDTLVIRSTSKNGEEELVQVDRWTLAADGATLMMARSAVYAGNPIGSPTWVFAKRP